MDLIYTNAEKEDVGVLLAYEMDLAFGADENNFECTVSRETNPCDAGCYLYINGTEYGGMIDAVKTDTASDDVVYTGRTWHGILNSKVIEPDAGEDYLVLNGEANAVIGTLISRLGLTDLFAADTAASGVTIKSFKMDRYIEGYNGIKKMLSRFGGKLRMAYTNGVVTLSAAPVVDYTEGVDSDFVDFTAKQVQNKVNHLICLGGGDLAARTVKHLYADSSGNISQTQTLTGINEYAAVYDYPNAASDEELISYGTDRFKELLNQDELNVTFDDDTDESYDIGDIVGATDNVSGVKISVAITKKIVSIKNGQIAISYDNPDGSSQAVVSSGGGGSSGGNGSFDALDVTGNAAIGGTLSVQGETTLNGDLNAKNGSFSEALSAASLTLDTPLSLSSGGLGASDADGARSNLAVAQKPKLLWSGSWSSGSITVPGFSDYKLFFVQTTDGDGAFCLVDFSLLLGGGLYPLTGTSGQMIYSIRAGVSGNTLSMQNSYAILRPKDSINGGQFTRTVNAIYGLLLNNDVLTEGE